MVYINNIILKLKQNEILSLNKIINNREKYSIKYGNNITRSGKFFVVDNNFEIIDSLIIRISKEIGINLQTLDCNKNTVTILEYLKGDFIAPHYDFNWSKGDKYTIMYEINKSNSNLMFFNEKLNKNVRVKSDNNSIVILNTGKIKHWVPKLDYGYRIVLLIEVYTSNVPVNIFKRIIKCVFDKLLI